MSKLWPVTKRGHDGPIGYMFDCPGCGSSHQPITVEHEQNHAVWQFNGDLERPTFSPSLLVRWEDNDGKHVCHFFVREGRIQFLNDCTHALAGQTVELPEVP